LNATGRIQVVQANHKSGHNVGLGPGTPDGQPYGQLVSKEAQDGDGGFGADIKSCRDGGGCQGDDNNGLGDIRASDEADKDGKSGNNRNENAGNPEN
jgi:hypothetical protein